LDDEGTDSQIQLRQVQAILEDINSFSKANKRVRAGKRVKNLKKKNGATSSSEFETYTVLYKGESNH